MEGKEIAQARDGFSIAEIEILEKFKNDGCPGLTRVVDSDVFQWFELYMAGKTHIEISNLTNSSRDLILYISDKSKWHQKRLQYYTEINDHMLQKCNEAKVSSVNTVANMVTALNKYFGDKFDKYLQTKDETIIENLDTRLLAQYYKATESIDKLIIAAGDNGDVGGGTRGGRSTVVNVNMLGGGKVTQTDDNTIEIDQSDDEKAKITGEILAGLSKLKKSKTQD
jgi:hypothetical protein